MRRPILLLLYALIGVGALAGLYGGWLRYHVEARNRRVELTLDDNEVRSLADITGQAFPAVLQRFRSAGVTSVAVSEDTFNSLEQQGALVVQPGSLPTRAVVNTPELLNRIGRALRAKGLTVRPGENLERGTRLSHGVNSLTLPVDFATLRPLGVGLDPQAVQAVRQAGLEPVGRIGNFPGASPQSMAAVLADLKSQGIATVIFQGLEVLGYRGLDKEAAEAIRQSGLRYGQIEFGKQKGDERLSARLKGEYVRVHSIGEAEMGTLDPNEAIDRFVRAARERNIRLCYIRLLTSVGADPVEANAAYLEKIARGIARGQEMAFGPAHLFGETGVPPWAFLLMAGGVAAGLTLLKAQFFPFSRGALLLLLVVFILICAGAVLLLGEMGRKLVALLAALVFPTLACLRRDLLGGEGGEGTRGRGGEAGVAGRKSQVASEDTQNPVLAHDSRLTTHDSVITPFQAARRAIGGLTAASAVTAVGILLIVGLLATRPFMLKANQFLGIKAAHALPILLIGVVAITGLPCLSRPWAQEWAALRERAARFLREPTRVGPLLLTLVALVALALVVARTGNDPGVGVSGLELKFRALLDRVLPVRPRTKEFLVGHPAFVLALALWFRGRRRWALPLFVVGVVGQVSLLNTFCHIHTPLSLSLIRAASGLVFGVLLGLAAFWVLEKAGAAGARWTAGAQVVDRE